MNEKWILFLIAAVAAATPPIALKEYNNRKLTHPDTRYIFILISMIAFTILIYVYIKIFDENKIGPYYALSKILAIILVTMGSILFFEDFITVKQTIGIMFGIITIILLIT